MARIRILQGVSGLDFSWSRGDVIELDDDAAARWADGYRAEYADPQQTPPPSAVTAPEGDAAPGTPPAPPELFDPGSHNVADTLAYLGTVGESEALRVLDAEAAGQDRKGIGSQRDAVLGGARALDAQRAEAPPAEVAAEQSAAGGRGDVPEIR